MASHQDGPPSEQSLIKASAVVPKEYSHLWLSIFLPRIRTDELWKGVSKREEYGPGCDEELLPEGRALSLSWCYLQLTQHPGCGSTAHTIKQAGWSKAKLTNLPLYLWIMDADTVFLTKFKSVGACVHTHTHTHTHTCAHKQTHTHRAMQVAG